MKTKSVLTLVAALMLPLLTWGQARPSVKSSNPHNSVAKASRKDSARVMKKGDKNNKMGTSTPPISKKMAKNRADQ